MAFADEAVNVLLKPPFFNEALPPLSQVISLNFQK
jgi:hypothetical protein